MKRPRPITAADRLLDYSDRMDAAIGLPKKSRRRTHVRVGKIDLLVIEATGEPTRVIVSEISDRMALVELTATELAEAAAAVNKILAAPPPVKRRPR